MISSGNRSSHPQHRQKRMVLARLDDKCNIDAYSKKFDTCNAKSPNGTLYDYENVLKMDENKGVFTMDFFEAQLKAMEAKMEAQSEVIKAIKNAREADKEEIKAMKNAEAKMEAQMEAQSEEIKAKMEAQSEEIEAIKNAREADKEDMKAMEAKMEAMKTTIAKIENKLEFIDTSFSMREFSSEMQDHLKHRFGINKKPNPEQQVEELARKSFYPRTNSQNPEQAKLTEGEARQIATSISAMASAGNWFAHRPRPDEKSQLKIKQLQEMFRNIGTAASQLYEAAAASHLFFVKLRKPEDSLELVNNKNFKNTQQVIDSKTGKNLIRVVYPCPTMESIAYQRYIRFIYAAMGCGVLLAKPRNFQRSTLSTDVENVKPNEYTETVYYHGSLVTWNRVDEDSPVPFLGDEARNQMQDRLNKVLGVGVESPFLKILGQKKKSFEQVTKCMRGDNFALAFEHKDLGEFIVEENKILPAPRLSDMEYNLRFILSGIVPDM